MTNAQETSTPRPIANWENDQVNGFAVTCKSVFDDHKEKVEALRERQEAYEKSLPSDPVEALDEITSILNKLDGITEPHYAARASLTIIKELSMNGGLDDSTQMSEAIYWLTNQGMEGLALMEDGVRRSNDISRRFHRMHKAYEA